jgi:hypothetical protein
MNADECRQEQTQTVYLDHASLGTRTSPRMRTSLRSERHLNCDALMRLNDDSRKGKNAPMKCGLSAAHIKVSRHSK